MIALAGIQGTNGTIIISSPVASRSDPGDAETTPVPVTPTTPAATAVNTSTSTPVGFTKSYTVPKSVETGLTALPTLDEPSTTTTSAEKSIQKTHGKSVVETVATLPGIETSSSTPRPIIITLPTETTAQGRVPTDTTSTKAKTTVVEDGTAPSTLSPTTTPPPGTDVIRTSTVTDSRGGKTPKIITDKTVDNDATALPALTSSDDAAPEQTDVPEPSPSVVVLPVPVPDDATSSTVAKSVVESAVVGETTFTVSQLTTIDGLPSTVPVRTTAKVVVSQTGLGAPTYVQPGDESDGSNTAGSGGNVGSYIACGLDKNCLETSAAQSQVVALPAPTQEPGSGGNGAQSGGADSADDDNNDGSGQHVPVNAPTDDFTYTAGAPTVVYNSNTLSVGGAAITISGAKVTLATGGLVVDGNTYTAPATAAGPTSQAVALPAAAAYTYDAADSTFVYGSATLSAGGPAITADGHTISLAPSGGGVVVDASTVAPSGDSSVVVLSSSGGSSAYAYTPGASTLAYGSTTLSVGGSALTIDGKTVTLASDGVLVDGSTVAPKPAAATLGTYAYTPGASTFVYGSTTLSVGGPDTTVGGQVVSLAPGGVVVDGSTVAASTRSPSPAAVVTLGDEVRTLTKGATLSLDGSAVLTLTPGAVATTLADGESVSVGRNGVVIDGKTVTFSNVSTTGTSGMATSRSTSTEASGSEGTGSAAAASSTAGAGRSLEVQAVGLLVGVLGWIGALIGTW